MTRLKCRTERERKSVSLLEYRNGGKTEYKVICRKGLLYEKIELCNDFDSAFQLYHDRTVRYLGLPETDEEKRNKNEREYNLQQVCC